MVEIGLERLARLQHQRHGAVLEALAPPDRQRAAPGTELHVGELQGGNLADARAGVADEAGEGERQAVVARDACLGRPAHGVPRRACQRLRGARHRVDPRHPAEGVVAAPTRRIVKSARLTSARFTVAGARRAATRVSR